MGTETVMRTMSDDLVARLDEISEDREMGRVQPGWWVRTVREDDTREWAYVVMWQHGKHTESGRKVAFLSAISPDEPSVLLDLRAWFFDPVCCITKAQARKLGLTRPTTTGEDPR